MTNSFLKAISPGDRRPIVSGIWAPQVSLLGPGKDSLRLRVESDKPAETSAVVF
jgi:hypothetical protein